MLLLPRTCLRSLGPASSRPKYSCQFCWSEHWSKAKAKVAFKGPQASPMQPEADQLTALSTAPARKSELHIAFTRLLFVFSNNRAFSYYTLLSYLYLSRPATAALTAILKCHSPSFPTSLESRIGHHRPPLPWPPRCPCSLYRSTVPLLILHLSKLQRAPPSPSHSVSYFLRSRGPLWSIRS